MSRLNFSEVVNWPESISKLPSLVELQLSSCNLPNVELSSLSFVNSSNSLEVLELSDNFLNLSIFYWMANVSTNLVHNGLAGDQLQGPFPDVFANMVSLVSLDLSYNKLEGLSLLRQLFISKNQLNGSITESIGQLSSLENLDLSWNSLNGVVTEAHFSNLSRLNSLDFSHNPLSFNLSSDWTPPFQIKSLGLSSARLALLFRNGFKLKQNLLHFTCLMLRFRILYLISFGTCLPAYSS
ncbi:receptor-like protein kinase 5 [Pyrus ussuriensis x Pyrus communis]|uniref:Receptor-like protein kinase 5 n=1 Tax=Pyrus ussuriensis x Pyrus communis TaxID=2448454 RepID=A0A5N5F0V1_9ROSA|nr:receptor-like protein kinase 5 [Pyrus ussuriensis x Pyrus communis]